MKIIALFTCALLVCLHAAVSFAQTDTSVKAIGQTPHIPWYKKPLISKDSCANTPRINSFFIEPISLIDVINGLSVRVGGEYRIFNSWAVTGTAGIYTNGPAFLRSQNGWIIKAELKKYLKPRNANNNLQYLSVEYCYRQSAYEQFDSIRIPGIPDYGKSYDISKCITSVRIKYGVMVALRHKLFVEYYWGFGVRYKSVTSTLTKQEYDNIDYILESESYRVASEVGRFFRPDLSLGIRFGIRY